VLRILSTKQELIVKSFPSYNYPVVVHNSFHVVMLKQEGRGGNLPEIIREQSNKLVIHTPKPQVIKLYGGLADIDGVGCFAPDLESF
jgi:hypothetical protein